MVPGQLRLSQLPRVSQSSGVAGPHSWNALLMAVRTDVFFGDFFSKEQLRMSQSHIPHRTQKFYA